MIVIKLTKYYNKNIREVDVNMFFEHILYDFKNMKYSTKSF
jgi:hypothetical protein